MWGLSIFETIGVIAFSIALILMYVSIGTYTTDLITDHDTSLYKKILCSIFWPVVLVIVMLLFGLLLIVAIVLVIVLLFIVIYNILRSLIKGEKIDWDKEIF